MKSDIKGIKEKELKVYKKGSTSIKIGLKSD